MIAADIRTHLIDRLEPIFGQPKNADGLAGQLERYLPEHATGSALEGLADRIIESRKAKGFPSASEMIALVKALPAPAGVAPASGKPRYVSPQERLEEERERDKAQERAIQMLRGTDLARRAVEERWAPALIEFVTKHGREPGYDEEQPLIAISRRNDVGARELRDMASGPFAPIAHGVFKLRGLMHAKAARLLGFGEAMPVGTKDAPRKIIRDPVITPVDPASLAPTDALLDRLAAKGA